MRTVSGGQWTVDGRWIVIGAWTNPTLGLTIPNAVLHDPASGDPETALLACLAWMRSAHRTS